MFPTYVRQLCIPVNRTTPCPVPTTPVPTTPVPCECPAFAGFVLTTATQIPKGTSEHAYTSCTGDTLLPRYYESGSSVFYVQFNDTTLQITALEETLATCYFAPKIIQTCNSVEIPNSVAITAFKQPLVVGANKVFVDSISATSGVYNLVDTTGIIYTNVDVSFTEYVAEFYLAAVAPPLDCYSFVPVPCCTTGNVYRFKYESGGFADGSGNNDCTNCDGTAKNGNQCPCSSCVTDETTIACADGTNYFDSTTTATNWTIKFKENVQGSFLCGVIKAGSENPCYCNDDADVSITVLAGCRQIIFVKDNTPNISHVEFCARIC